MTRAPRFFFVLVAAVFLAPIATAQGTVTIEEITLIDSDGDELRIVAVDAFVSVEVVVNNTGSATIDGPLTLNLTIEASDGSYVKYANLNRPGPVEAGNQTTFSYSWAPAQRTQGEYKITARMVTPASSEGLVATFTVAETSVESGNIVEQTLSYYWVFGLFLAAIIVFFVVLVARRS